MLLSHSNDSLLPPLPCENSISGRLAVGKVASLTVNFLLNGEKVLSLCFISSLVGYQISVVSFLSLVSSEKLSVRCPIFFILATGSCPCATALTFNFTVPPNHTYKVWYEKKQKAWVFVKSEKVKLQK